MDKKSLSLTLFGALILPFTAFAQGQQGPTIASMTDAIVTNVLYVAGGVVIIMWVVTGILFLTAGGEPGKINTAKTALFAAVGGTLLVILASGAIAFVRTSFGL